MTDSESERETEENLIDNPSTSADTNTKCDFKKFYF